MVFYLRCPVRYAYTSANTPRHLPIAIACEHFASNIARAFAPMRVHATTSSQRRSIASRTMQSSCASGLPGGNHWTLMSMRR